VAKSGVGKKLAKPLNVIVRGPLLENVGRIDPECICDYLIAGGYGGLKKALKMSPTEIVDEIKRSDLRGRGGAGFPVGMKWEFTAKATEHEKYVVCNADEGEPGTFKDRALMEYDPHKVIEGLIIACYVIGASHGLIYIRGEYVLAAARLEAAIEEAKVWGLLGKRIWGTDFSCDLEIVRGAGAYVVGEETALLESIEGKRGEPRAKPPYPAEKGLFEKPTAVNNVETLANIPAIILNGAEWYRSLGSGGTKLFSLSGDLKKKGVAEIPLGKMKLSEVINNFGGGVDGSGEAKAIILSGVSGSLITPDKFEMVLDAKTAGCGSIIVLNQKRGIVDAVKNIMHFFVHESCGRCIPCSRGGKEIYDIICRFADGLTNFPSAARIDDLELLKELGENMKISSFCPLGQSAANILLASLEKFRDEWLACLDE
jgi:NADH:ubiquinone oxidoreductase subunit F (NADH-binding)